MVKDTIHTTELDTAYTRGVELLRKRKYAKALYVLNDYNDRNTVVAHLSLGHDERAMELLANGEALRRMSENLEKLARPDAAERIVDEIEKVMK